MPLPSSAIIDLAKAYAYRIERGKTPAEARAYLRDNFPATPGEIRRAVYEVQKGMKVQMALSELAESSTLGEVFRTAGVRMPADTVGVRIQVVRTMVTAPGDPPDVRANDLYVDVGRADTIQTAIDRAMQWADTQQRGSGPQVSVSYRFVGPTLWPGQTPGVV